MNILNVYVYLDQKEQCIKLRLDRIHSQHIDLFELPVNIMQYALTLPDEVSYNNEKLADSLLLKNFISHYVAESQDDFFKALKLENIYFKDQNMGFKVDSVIYTLPNNPLLILQWVCCLSVYLNSSNRYYDVCFFQKNIDNDLPLSMSLRDYYKNSQSHKNGTLLKLHEELSAFKEEGFFKKTFQVLDNMFQFYKARRESTKPLTMLVCMQKKHCDILWGDLTKTLLNPALNSKVKLQELFKTARAYLYSDRAKELNQMLTSIHFFAKTKLIEQCIGRPSHDERLAGYGWNYTEFPLFLDNKVQFNLTKDGLMCVSGYLETKGYLKNYAKGKGNHSILEGEMIFLGKVLGLEFEPGDFHQQMIFNKESTEKLMALGLHYNTHYVKNLFKMQKYSNFFKRHMPELPSDVFNHITYLSLDTLDFKEAEITLGLPTPAQGVDEVNEQSHLMQM